MSSRAHQLVPQAGGGVRCSVCLGVWAKSTKSRCAGIRTYRAWADVPPTLKTKTQLKELGLRSVGPRVGVMRSRTYHVDYDLWDVGQATDRVTRGPLSAEALAARQRTLKTCGACGSVGEVVPRASYGFGIAAALAPWPRLCEGCYDRLSRVELLREIVPYLLGPRTDEIGILDLETTGLDPESAIVEIGLCALDGTPLYGALVDLEPGELWGSEEMTLTGLSPRAVRGCARRREALEGLADTIEAHGITVLAGWGGCDARWISHQTNQARKAEDRMSDERAERLVGARYLDLQFLYGQIGVEAPHPAPREDRGWTGPRVSLARACRAHGVSQPVAHRALQDAQAAAAVIRRCLTRWSQATAERAAS